MNSALAANNDFCCCLPMLPDCNKNVLEKKNKKHFCSYLVASCYWLTGCGRVCQVFAGLKPWALRLVCQVLPVLICQAAVRLWLDASDHIDSRVPLKILQASMNLRLEVWQEAEHVEIFSSPLNMNVLSDKQTKKKNQCNTILLALIVVISTARTNQFEPE